METTKITITITLSVDEINVILGHLSQGKYADVASTFEKVRSQASAQVTTPSASAEDASTV